MVQAIDRLLRIREVAALSGLSVSTIQRLRAAGSFPHAIQVAARAVRWKESSIRAWIDAQPDAGQ